ncbi:MAG: hypothetical protein AB7H90_20535 [Alphaproteobacteria bacterium]
MTAAAPFVEEGGACCLRFVCNLLLREFGNRFYARAQFRIVLNMPSPDFASLTTSLAVLTARDLKLSQAIADGLMLAITTLNSAHEPAGGWQ